MKAVKLDNARSVANRPLPAIPDGLAPDAGTLVLFYQYTEPVWTPTQHKWALKNVIALAEKNGITGRGRCAPEGLNCTLSGSPQGVRDFCQGLRDWNPLYNETDFKLTDGLKCAKPHRSHRRSTPDDRPLFLCQDAEACSISSNQASRGVQSDHDSKGGGAGRLRTRW